MKALVTGGAGFIGSALARALLEGGDDVSCLDDLSNGDKAAVPQGVTFIEGDIRDEHTRKSACVGVDVVFHQAALRSVPRSLDQPTLVHEVNATGTLAMLQSAREAGVSKFVYASSSSVYGGSSGGKSSEDMTPHPLSPYAVSKLVGEHYCKVWSDLGWVPTVSLRYFNVFGPGQRADSQYAAVFPSFVSAMLRDEAPEIHWDGEQSRDFTYIEDVVRANLLAAEVKDAEGRVINAAGGTPRTINEVFASVADAMGKSIEPRYAPKRDGDVRHSSADSDLARSVLGWRPEVPLQQGVARTVEWFLSEGSRRT